MDNTIMPYTTKGFTISQNIILICFLFIQCLTEYMIDVCQLTPCGIVLA